MLWSTMPPLEGRSWNRLTVVSDTAVSDWAFSCGTDVCVHAEGKGEGSGERVPAIAARLGVSHPPALQLPVGCGREEF